MTRRPRFDLYDDELALFCHEVSAQIDVLEAMVFDLEQGTLQAVDRQAAFRAAHSIKGCAATIGHTQMAKLAHDLETVLASLSDRPDDDRWDWLDALFLSVDVLRVLLHEVEQDFDAGIDLEPIRERLRALTDADQQPRIEQAVAPMGAWPRTVVTAPEVDLRSSGYTDMRIVLRRLSRVAGELAVQQGKRVRLEVLGVEVEVERLIAEALWSPLVQLVRNAIAHGIELPDERVAMSKPETGTVTVAATLVEGNLRLTVQDDGRGIDTASVRREALSRELVGESAIAGATEDDVAQLIFVPGLSTAEAVTELSGRGFGMDIVKNAVEGLVGQVTVHSVYGRGTEFVLEVPIGSAAAGGHRAA